MSISAAPMIDHGRLVAPPEHLGLLIEPTAETLRALLTRPTSARLEATQILGRSLSDWRSHLRESLDVRAPVIVTGHQAEFFHAGVFAKTVTAALLAETESGSAVFLTVDSDQPKGRTLAVPEITGSGLRRVDVEIPERSLLRPDECQPEAPRERWLEFFVRIASLYEHYDASLLRSFADAWLDCDRERIAFCDALARGYRALEAELGLTGVREVRMSTLCRTSAFRAFVAHLVLHADTLANHYNEAQAAYRRRHRVHAANRPVPPLVADGARTEVPFWVFHCEGPRTRLFVERTDGQIRFFAGREPIGTVDVSRLADPAALHAPWDFEERGWQLRPRALTLSGFCRLFLGDLFIHGIGGAKYDEATDEFLPALLGTELPPIGCVSATLHLPLPRTGVRERDLHAARYHSRDIRFNPQRYIQNLPEDLLRRRNEAIRRSDELRAQNSKDHQVRHALWLEIRRLNEKLLECDPWRAAALDQRVQSLTERFRADAVAFDREYFVGLHLKSTLEELVGRIGRALRCA